MPIPPMKPSAKERVDVRITNVSGPTIVVHRQAAQELVQEAYRDGYAANDRAERMLAVLRDNGWMIAIHNDYRQGGKLMTFWLMVKGEIAVKGEGETDAEALQQITDRAAALHDPTRLHRDGNASAGAGAVTEETWLTDEAPPRKLIVKGRSLIDSDCLVAYLEGGSKPLWIIEYSGYVCGLGSRVYATRIERSGETPT